MGGTVLDFINDCLTKSANKEQPLTYEEWCTIRRTGTAEEIEEAAERMMAQGGYDNLV